VVVIIAAAAVYSQRGPIGTRLAVDYLQRHGIPAVIHFERLGPGGFTGSAVLGPANDPDLVIEHMEVEFEAIPFSRTGPRVREIRLVRPVLKATYRDGKVTFGTLQGLIEEILAQPVTGPPPGTVIEGGIARIVTSAGLVQVNGDASIQQGRLVHVDARMGRHSLAAGSRSVQIEAATLQLRGANGRLNARLRAGSSGWLEWAWPCAAGCRYC
jgi:hypothetical protein